MSMIRAYQHKRLSHISRLTAPNPLGILTMPNAGALGRSPAPGGKEKRQILRRKRMAHPTVIRVEQVHACDLGAAAGHIARTRNGVLAARERDATAYNDSIDLTRTNNNCVIAGNPDIRAAVLADIAGYDFADKRSDNVAAQFVLSMNKDFFNNFDDSMKKKWCCDAVSALSDYLQSINAGKILSAYAHYDEETPHVHVITSVIHETFSNKKTSRGLKINYGIKFSDKKSVIAEARKKKTVHTDTKLGRLQTGYTEALKKYGWDVERGIENSKLTHMQQSEYHKEQRQKKSILLQRKIDDLQEKIDRLQTEYESMQKTFNSYNKKTLDLYTSQTDALLKKLLSMRELANNITDESQLISINIKILTDITPQLNNTINSVIKFKKLLSQNDIKIIAQLILQKSQKRTAQNGKSPKNGLCNVQKCR